MRNIGILSAVAISMLTTHVVYAADGAAATVNAQPVKQAWVDVIKKQAGESGRKLGDKEILVDLLDKELLSQEAIRLGIDKQQDFSAREEITHRELLSNMLIKDYLDKNPISEEMIKAKYEEIKARPGIKEYNVRHIQVKTETEAKDVVAKLAKGADFAKLAKEKSLDAQTKDKGGLIGWVTNRSIIAPLGDAVGKLQKGLFNTVPLQSSAGWHVLKLEDVRDVPLPAYDKIKGQLRQQMTKQQISKLLEELRAKAKIEIAK